MRSVLGALAVVAGMLSIGLMSADAGVGVGAAPNCGHPVATAPMPPQAYAPAPTCSQPVAPPVATAPLPAPAMTFSTPPTMTEEVIPGRSYVVKEPDQVVQRVTPGRTFTVQAAPAACDTCVAAAPVAYAPVACAPACAPAARPRRAPLLGPLRAIRTNRESRRAALGMEEDPVTGQLAAVH